jgi:hypothetical protein
MLSCTTAQHIYCTNCTVCNWTVLTVITQKLLLYVQLHNSTAHLLYKYCTNCTVCNWTVLTVITHKLLLHAQLQNSTAHLPYKYCTNCTLCKWTVLTVITHKLPLHVQQHKSTQTVQLLSSEVECGWLFDITSTYTIIYIYTYTQIWDPSKNSKDSKRTPQIHNVTQHQSMLLSGDCKTAN